MDEASPARPRWQLALRSLIALFSVLLFPLLLYLVVRIFYGFPMSYNEGWNVMFTSRLLAGEPLYVPLDGFPLTPLNYPPLSFAIVGALSVFAGDVLLTGRMVTLFSSAIVALLIFRIVTNLTGQKSAGVFAALFWLALMARLGHYRLVMYDPQLLAHAFSVAALCLFTEWREALTARKAYLFALLCCIALFVKHLVVVVPVVLAIALFLENKKALWQFVLAGLVLFALMAYASWHYGGDYLLSNFLDTGRAVLNWKLRSRMRTIFVLHLVLVVFLPFLAVLASRQKKWTAYLFYYCLSFTLGAYSIRGVGVDINAWFDFFIAAAIIYGIVAGEGFALERQPDLWKTVILYGIVVAALLPLTPGLRSGLTAALNYDELRRSEQSYERQVGLLKSIPGPALFEELLLGYDAGKEFLLEPFNAAQMMNSGRMPENVLTDAIRRREFGAIVLEFNLDDVVCRLNEIPADGERPRSAIKQRWTDNTLRAVSEHYEPLDKERFPYYFYVPRKNEAPLPACSTGGP